MIRCALLAAVILAGVGHSAPAQSPLAVWVDVDGTAYLWNTTDAPISFDGYQFVSDSGRLSPLGWLGISEQATQVVISSLGGYALLFGQGSQGAGTLAEIALGGWATLQPQDKFGIGKPFLDVVNTEATSDFFYRLAGEVGQRQGDIWVPEPSTFLLAALAGLGLLAVGRAKSLRRSGPTG